MPRKCGIPTCKKQRDDPGCLSLGFRQIPTNEDMQKKWINSILSVFGEERRDIFEKKFFYVCDLHFEDSCFYYVRHKSRRMLSKGSFPTVFSNFKTNESPTALEESEIQNETHSFNINNIKLEEDDVGSNEIINYVILDNVDFDKNNLMNYADIQSSSTNSDIKNILPTNCNSSLTINSSEDSSLDKVPNVQSLNNVDELKRLFLKAQADSKAKSDIISRQHRTIKNLRMKLHRRQKRERNLLSLIIHRKERKKLSDKVSNVPKVSENNCKCVKQ